MAIDFSARDVVRERVTEGLARRRGRRAVRELARIAPWVAAVALVAAVLARMLGWPIAATWIGLGAAAVGVGAWFVWRRRAPAATDLMASSLDADAGLGGELRSAFWFADQRDQPDPWAAFHLERAAERLTVLEWSDFYPPVRATRSWVITAVLVAVTAIVTVRLPVRHTAAAGVKSATIDTADLPLEAMLPPDVRKRLEDLLKQIEQGKIAAAAANAKLEELRDLLSKIDPSIDPQLANLAKRADEAAKAEGNGDPRSLADRAKAAAASDLPADMREQLKDLASKLANPRVGERQGESQNASASTDAGQLGKASQGAQASEASMAQAALQLSREAASDPSGKMMLAGAGSMGGDSTAGAGGNKGAKTGNAAPSLIAQALRQELIEASADTQGQNVSAEDIRRKTEQSKSVLGFTHVVAPPAVDPSRTLPPPPVPDARKPLVMQYFIRR